MSYFQTVVNPSCLDLGVFQIRPSVFEVLAGERISLELLFAPDEIKDYSEDLVLICDNCQVKYFTIQGFKSFSESFVTEHKFLYPTSLKSKQKIRVN